MADRVVSHRTPIAGLRLIICGLINIVSLCQLETLSPRFLAAADDLQSDQEDFGWDDDVQPIVKSDAKPRFGSLSIKGSLYGRDRDENSAILQFNTLLKQELAAAQLAHDFDAKDVKKLALAGHRDISRFVSHVSEFHDRCIKGDIPLDDIPAIQIEIKDLRKQMDRQNLFGSRSLFGKTLKKTLATLKRTRKPDCDSTF